jgi:outer membrane lipoprotein SlyB
VATGGGAALGGIIGGLVGGGKGAAIGLAAGAGAGAGGSALTGNKDIVLPAESNITFELSQALELRK